VAHAHWSALACWPWCVVAVTLRGMQKWAAAAQNYLLSASFVVIEGLRQQRSADQATAIGCCVGFRPAETGLLQCSVVARTAMPFGQSAQLVWAISYAVLLVAPELPWQLLSWQPCLQHCSR